MYVSTPAANARAAARSRTRAPVTIPTAQTYESVKTGAPTTAARYRSQPFSSAARIPANPGRTPMASDLNGLR